MSDEKPTVSDLTAYGKCLIDSHYELSFAKILKLKVPGADTSDADTKAYEAAKQGIVSILKNPGETLAQFEKHEKEHILGTIGIDGILRGDQDAVDQCSVKAPRNLPNTIPAHVKAAIIPRT